MLKQISIDQYLAEKDKHLVIDVRSPKEFAHAHIPGAINIPLFDDAERAVVGIAYKHEGRDIAIEKGLEIVGPKMTGFVVQAKQLIADAGKTIVLHCWRGGMRSKSMAMLFDFAGIKSAVVKGGYKSYRQAAKLFFEKEFPLIILGGRTGSAKTKILHALKAKGEQVIDLEKLANHKGSAFGNLGEEKQPSTEMFENLLFDDLRQLDAEKYIWVENESQLVGQVFIPDPFWKSMRPAPLINLEFPIEERIQFLVDNYGNYAAADIEASLLRVRKKLGGQHYTAALEYFRTGNLTDAVRTALVYYDKTYTFCLQQRKPETVFTIALQNIDPGKNAAMLIEKISTLKVSNAIEKQDQHNIAF